MSGHASRHRQCHMTCFRIHRLLDDADPILQTIYRDMLGKASGILGVGFKRNYVCSGARCEQRIEAKAAPNIENQHAWFDELQISFQSLWLVTPVPGGVLPARIDLQ